MLKNIAPGTGGSKPADFTQIGNRVFFSANDGSTGRELWVTDGTPAGTVLVKNIRPGSKSSSPAQLTAVGNKLFFTANGGLAGRELWKSDGTAAGTVQVRDLNPPCGVGPSNLTSFGGKLYFVIHFAYCSGPIPTSPYGSRLWRSDGTNAGTFEFRDRDHGYLYNPSGLVVSGSYLYFGATNDWPKYPLWRTDGHSSTTKPIKSGLYPENLTDVGGTLFFTDSTIEPGSLWKSNGTKAGTVRLNNTIGWRVSELTDAGGWLGLKEGDSYTGTSTLWTSDGTAQGTSSEFGGEFVLSDLTGVNGTLYYAIDGYLWYTSGPGAGGSPVVPYDEGETTSWQISQLTDVNGTLFYSATDKNATTGRELWAYTP